MILAIKAAVIVGGILLTIFWPTIKVWLSENLNRLRAGPVNKKATAPEDRMAEILNTAIQTVFSESDPGEFSIKVQSNGRNILIESYEGSKS